MAHTNLVPGALTGSSGSTGALLFASTAAASVGIWSTVAGLLTTSKYLTAQRFANYGQGTALTSNNFSLSSGWGSSATLSGIAGTDQAYRLTITVGATVFATPTWTTTFADGAWQTAPVTLAQMVGTTGSLVDLTQTVNTSGEVMAVAFTPSTGATYTFSVIHFG